MTDEKLQQLTFAAYACEGEPFEYFQERVSLLLNPLSEGEIYAFAGMLLRHGCLEQAKFVADYARSVHEALIENRVRLKPDVCLASWLYRQALDPDSDLDRHDDYPPF